MNERIKRILEQAVTRFDRDMDGSMEPADSGRWVPFDDMEKFAELIVKECAKIADYHYTRNDCVSGRNLKKHFGVEL